MPTDPPADSMGDGSDADGDGEGSDGESCHDDDTTVALGSPSPLPSVDDEEGAANEDHDDNDKSMDEEKEFIDKRPMDASSVEMGDASSTESPMSPGDVTGFGGDIGGCHDESESDFEFETDNESTSPWEKTGDSQMYKAMRRAYLAEGKDWPPTWDDGRPDFEAYRAAHTTPAKRSHPVPSGSGIKPSKAPKMEASQQDKMNVTWQRFRGVRDGKTLISKLNFHYDGTIHHT